ncbi:hypothetical protein GCM10023324_69310 [Streptomyces youssoufiensis]
MEVVQAAARGASSDFLNAWAVSGMAATVSTNAAAPHGRLRRKRVRIMPGLWHRARGVVRIFRHLWALRV